LTDLEFSWSSPNFLLSNVTEATRSGHRPDPQALGARLHLSLAIGRSVHRDMDHSSSQDSTGLFSPYSLLLLPLLPWVVLPLTGCAFTDTPLGWMLFIPVCTSGGLRSASPQGYGCGDEPEGGKDHRVPFPRHPPPPGISSQWWPSVPSSFILPSAWGCGFTD
jgi:hypothetical protein